MLPSSSPFALLKQRRPLEATSSFSRKAVLLKQCRPPKSTRSFSSNAVFLKQSYPPQTSLPSSSNVLLLKHCNSELSPNLPTRSTAIVSRGGAKAEAHLWKTQEELSTAPCRNAGCSTETHHERRQQRRWILQREFYMIWTLVIHLGDMREAEAVRRCGSCRPGSRREGLRIAPS